MTTRAVASLLRRAWLLAATLAVTAGLLGMHVLTSGHASHGSASRGSVSQAAAGHTAVAHPAGGGHAGHRAGAATVDAPDLAGASCGSSCPGAQESGVPCIPSAPSAPVTLGTPQATLAVLPALPPAGDRRPACGYLPPTPTPCDLSISRT